MSGAGHILIVASEFPPFVHAGGLGTHVAELARELTALGRRVTICVPVAADAKAGEAATTADAKAGEAATRAHRAVGTGSAVRVLPLGRSGDALEAHPFVALLPWSVRRCVALHLDVAKACVALAADPPDVVHAHDHAQADVAILLSRRLRVPLVATIHILYHPTLAAHYAGGVPAAVRRRERRLCERAAMVITVCEANRDLVVRQHNVARFRTRVIHNGIDVDRWMDDAPERPNELRARYARPGERIVLYAGRVSRQKGVRQLLASAIAVVSAYPSVRYLVVGRVGDFLPDARGFEDEIRETLARHPAVAERVTFVGKVGRDALAGLYRIADLALVPSMWESSSYAALEAMAAGVPVVASAVGGLRELIRHEVDGLLVPMGPGRGGPVVDVPALAAAQLGLLNDPLRARALGRAAQTRVQQDLTSALMARKTILVYDHVVARARAGGRRA